MSKFGTSQSVLRKEDRRFLTGEGRFLDDAAPERTRARRLLPQPGRACPHRPARDRGGGGRPRRPRGLARRQPRRAARQPDEGRPGAQPRRLARGGAAAADPGRGAGALRRRADRAGGGGEPRRGDGRGRGHRRRLRRPAGACGDRGRRPDDPPGGSGQPGLRLGLRRRGGGGGGLRGGGAHHAARARRQPGDGDADGAARLLRGMGRAAAARGLLGPGGLGAARRAGRAARPGGRGGQGDDAGRGRRLRDEGLQLPGVFRRGLRRARARAAGALDEHPRRGDGERHRRARPCDGGGGGVRRRLPAAGAQDRLRLQPRRLQRARRAADRLEAGAEGDARGLRRAEGATSR